MHLTSQIEEIFFHVEDSIFKVAMNTVHIGSIRTYIPSVFLSRSIGLNMFVEMDTWDTRTFYSGQIQLCGNINSNPMKCNW